MKTAAPGAIPDIESEDAYEGVDPQRGTTDEQEAAADAIRNEFREKHPDIHLEKIRTPISGAEMPGGGKRCLLGLLRVIDPATWQMVLEKSQHADAAQRASVDRLVFNACVLYPKGPELATMLKRFPAIVKVWAGEATEMSGSFRGSMREKV